ncbi:MAG: tRNA (adenosine(37)-N6)-threonylcarbamoyltransferase complex dimerization subunit type 1 TsaB [Planctomycetota bacterium]|nr:tRNA (adenosine(37)-N6)-threonylcarbamoyltransferase complex dimerization subunit type 1 TsaB [Planctomycetota bacterium]
MTAPLVLAIETSTRRGSVAARGPRGASDIELAGARKHASDLVPAVDRVLAEIDASASDIEAIAVGTGPGSFTGLRVGVATAYGLARGSGAILVGVPSFEALVLAEVAPGEEALVTLDARAGAFYAACYRRGESDVVVLHPPAVVTAAELRALVPEAGPILADEGAASVLGEDQRERVRLDVSPRARSVLELGTRRAESAGSRGLGGGFDAIEPLYLQPFRTRRRAMKDHGDPARGAESP